MSTEIFCDVFPLEVHALQALVLFGCIYQKCFLFCFPLSVPETDWSKICVTSGFLFHKFSITLTFAGVNWANFISDFNKPGIEVRHKCHKIQYLCMISKLNQAKLEALFSGLKTTQIAKQNKKKVWYF